MNHLPSALLLLFVLTSCSKEAQKDKVSDLEAEVMTIHDEVMPQMDEIMT